MRCMGKVWTLLSAATLLLPVVGTYQFSCCINDCLLAIIYYCNFKKGNCYLFIIEAKNNI